MKKQKSYEAEALALYSAAMQASRQPVFYTDLAVPDTMDGRFDLLLVHIFLILSRLLENQDQQDDLAQALFDTAFADFDQALRETGIGDMGIAKHIKRMMLAFNGRMHAYHGALEAGGHHELEEVLKRNLYGTAAAVPEDTLAAMAAYITENTHVLAEQPKDALRAGRVHFADAPATAK